MKQQRLLFCILLFVLGFTVADAQTISFSGTVFDDGTEGPTSGIPTNMVGDKPLWAIYSRVIDYGGPSLPRVAQVVASIPVKPDGTYSFSNIPNVIFCQVSLATEMGMVGTSPPSSRFPNAIRAGAIDAHFQQDYGLDNVFFNGIADQAAINFRFNQLPTTNSITAPSQPIPNNGTTQVTVPTLTGSDPEDGPYNGISGTNTIAITSIYPNPILVYKGQILGNYVFIPNVAPHYLIENYDPSQLKVIPAKGSTSVFFQYHMLDAAKRWSLSPGTVNMPFEFVALPVDLTHFEGKWIEGKGNQLSWGTAWEQNNDRFEIQASTNAKSFESIGRVMGKGTTPTGQSYTFVDAQPQADLTYYRLKQVDLDGSFTYSRIIAIQRALNQVDANLLVYPNPVSDQLNLQLSGQQTPEEVSIYAIGGQQLLNQPLLGSSVNVKSLPSGIYVVEIKTAKGQVLRQRFIKE